MVRRHRARTVIVGAPVATSFVRLRCPTLVLVLLGTVSVVPASARADRPTSGAMSLISGRTLGNGEVAVAGAVGYPGAWGQLTLAPSSTLNVGVRGGLLYGSPVAGFETGFGGMVSAPIRIHILGAGSLDLSITAEPMVVIGEGALVGEGGAFSDNFGVAGGASGGAIFGWRATEAITFAFGAAAEVWVLSVPDTDDAEITGLGLAIVGVEALLSRRTLLFAEFRGGVGHRPRALFSSAGIFRFVLGLGHRL